jgi:exodeoxyribonuclease X
VKIADATLCVVDTETTGLDYATGDRIVEFAAQVLPSGMTCSTLVNPGRPIPVVASAVHHLTDIDVMDKLPLEAAYRFIDAWVPSDAVVVAHNAQFDRSFLPSLADRRWLCSKRLAQHLISDAPAYSNQVLRYHLGGGKLDLRGQAPHRALADVIVTSFVLDRLINRYLTAGYPDDIDCLVAFAASPITYTHMPFGKYRNDPIANMPLSYIEWALRNAELDADLRFSLTSECDRRSGVAA